MTNWTAKANKAGTKFDASCTLTDKELDEASAYDILDKLNDAGFELGRGHEQIEFNYSAKNDCYVLDALPFVGCGNQQVIFERQKEET